MRGRSFGDERVSIGFTQGVEQFLRFHAAVGGDDDVALLPVHPRRPFSRADVDQHAAHQPVGADAGYGIFLDVRLHLFIELHIHLHRAVIQQSDAFHRTNIDARIPDVIARSSPLTLLKTELILRLAPNIFSWLPIR